MGARWLLILAASVALGFAGCGEPPAAKFVLSERTKQLDRAARTAVENELATSFGDPNHLVVWRKLPIDFGEFAGTVEKAGKSAADPLVVSLTRGSGSTVALASDQLNGAAIIWISGSNSDATAQDAKGKDVPIDFQVDRYDAKSGELSLRVSPAGVAEKLEAPHPGDKLALLGPMLQQGHRLYMTHCVHCHGVSGDGNGPTAKYFDILPRDYRMGKFKFTSTRSTDKVRRDDLARTIRQGIPGTYMPSFLLFKDEELGPIVEYVRWLAMRGEFEDKSDVEFSAEQYGSNDVAQRVKGGESREQIESALAKYVTSDYPRVSSEAAEKIASDWTTAEQTESVVIPKKPRTPDSADSRERGKKLFFSDVAKCATCHGPAGRGDGPQTEDYQVILGTNKKRAVPGLFDDWGHPIKPRDLTSGIYRGGRRPLDIYRRVFSGIKGTPMPPFGQALNDDQIWDLVNYAMSLPFQKGRGYPEREIEQHKIASASGSAPSGRGEN